MKTLLLTLLTLITSSSLSFAQEMETAYLNLDDNGIAIKGYDPVSYFISDDPSEGKNDFSYEYQGATYLFVNQNNLNTFKADPEKYAPAYGGWCAYAVGKGSTADIDPNTYKIFEGKLLLFYNKFFTNTLKKWNKDEKNLSKNAEQNWPKIKSEKQN